MAGSLTVVGTGMKLIRQVTIEALDHIRRAEKLFYLVADGWTQRWLEVENPSAEGLESSLAEDRERSVAYADMVERMLAPARAGKQVCAAFYGHPGVYVSASHAAVERARREGLPAAMLPGVSAEDCLFADVGIDPAQHGCQSFEATDFLLCERRFDPRSLLVLWQVGVVGVMGGARGTASRAGLGFLVEILLKSYPPDHEVVLYEAAQHPERKPRIDRLPLQELGRAEVSPISTLLVPIREAAVPSLALTVQLSMAFGHGSDGSDGPDGSDGRDG